MTSTNPLTEAQRIADTLGVVLGAASCSEQVTEQRLDSAATKLRQLVLATANDGADAEVAYERFSAAVEAGQTAAEMGKIDPEDAAAALTEMEEQLAP
jgi:hypothetical protein